MDVDAYCREVETYLCRKNDGHLIRIVGPAFDRVRDWAAQGVPLSIVRVGVDRYVERYHAKATRRRPVRIEFCEPDVLEQFDRWRRAVGLSRAALTGEHEEPGGDTRRRPGLEAHLERIVSRLRACEAEHVATGDAAPETGLGAVVSRVRADLEAMQGGVKGLRGEARQAVLDRLAALDRELLEGARTSLSASERAALRGEAETELAPFRLRMTAAAFERAVEASSERLMRARLRLPELALP